MLSTSSEACPSKATAESRDFDAPEYSGRSSESPESLQEEEEEGVEQLDLEEGGLYYQDQVIDDLDGSYHTLNIPARAHASYGLANASSSLDEGGDASDYYPSDAEEEVPIHSKLSSKTLRNYIERSGASRERINQAISSSGLFPPGFHAPEFLYAQMRKYNFEEMRWVNKGPVMLYFLPCTVDDRPSRLIANYLYGTKSIALNLEIWELWDRYLFPCNNRSVAFSTCGHNAVVDANITTIKTLLGHLLSNIPSDSQYLPVESCFNNVQAVPEAVQSRGSVFYLRFIQPHERDLFMHKCHTEVQTIRLLRLVDRVQTFSQGPYAPYRHFVKEALATSGLVDMQDGSGGTRCVKCFAEFPPFDIYSATPDSVLAAHRSHPAAIHAKCPFAFALNESVADSTGPRGTAPRLDQDMEMEY